MNPLLSIVVPTKNKHYYLEFLVRYFHSIDSDKIEFIIQDNSDLGSNQDFIVFLEKMNDSRVSYLYTSEELTIDENCDLALNRAKGEYITMIGDDDAFSKYIVEYVEEFKKDNLDAILPAKSSYIWPDVKPRFYKGKLSGTFRIKNFNFETKKINVKLELHKVLAIGGTEMLSLPRIYHGIIKKTILEKIYEETNTYFPGPSPDMANAVASCKFIEKYRLIDVPLIISGHSKSSGGGQGSQGKHYGEISELKFLPKDTIANWTKCIPFYWSGFTIYAESVFQALKRTGRKGDLDKFNLEYLIASCIVFDTNYKDRIHLIFDKFNFSKKVKVYYYFFVVWVKRLNHHLNNNLVLLLPNRLRKEDTMFQKINIFEVAILNDELIANGLSNSNK